MAILNLTSVRAKLARAQEHAQTIKNEILAWTDRSPYSLTNEVNADSTRYSIFLHINEPPPLQRWSLMVADCISNLRAALDHLVYSIAVKEAAPNAPVGEDKLLFPITDNRIKFDEAVKRGRLGMIGDPIRAVIESFQPYNRPHDVLPPFLALLRDFNNRDKHKLLQIAFSVIARGEIGLVGEHPPDGRVLTPMPRVEALEDGAEIFAIVCDRPTPNMKFDKHVFDIVIALRHNKRDPSGPAWTDRTEIAGLLSAIAIEVRSVIYGIAGKMK